MTNRLLFIVSAVVLTLACLHSTAQATPLFWRTSSTGSTPAMRVGKWKLQLPRKQRPVSVLVLLASSFCCGSGTCAAEEKPNVVSPPASCDSLDADIQARTIVPLGDSWRYFIQRSSNFNCTDATCAHLELHEVVLTDEDARILLSSEDDVAAVSKEIG